MRKYKLGECVKKEGWIMISTMDYNTMALFSPRSFNLLYGESFAAVNSHSILQ
jgi:hypothetical protein